ncbi:hypothetical protein [Curtobacterium sp. NPDC088465]|uniref:hypothetical protein n=1 Tax=Curtobacterium sp. NPDC088465 TaxID=3363967 RepID=UPI00380559E2
MFDPQTTFGWFDVVGLGLTLLGLALAYLQARGANKVAKATARAAKETQATLAHNQLLYALGQVQQVVNDIDSAATGEDRSVLIFSLVRFANVATESAQLLDKHDEEHGALPEDLRKLSEDALNLKATIARSSVTKISRPSEALRLELSRASLRLTTTTTDLRNSIQGVSGV